MIKYICKKCNINTETSVCPVCGERAEMESSSIYWCDTCNIPLYDEICPMCGKKAHRIGSDLRPVFPEERLLLEIMIGEPFVINIGKEVVKEFLLNPNAMYLEAEEIYKKYQK